MFSRLQTYIVFILVLMLPIAPKAKDTSANVDSLDDRKSMEVVLFSSKTQKYQTIYSPNLVPNKPLSSVDSGTYTNFYPVNNIHHHYVDNYKRKGFEWWSLLEIVAAFLGALLSGLAAIFVFKTGEKSKKTEKDAEMKQRLSEFAGYIDAIGEDVNTAIVSVKNYVDLVYKEYIRVHEMDYIPLYFIQRLRNLDVTYISKTFSYFKLKGDSNIFIKRVEFLNVILPYIKDDYIAFSGEVAETFNAYVTLSKKIKEKINKESKYVRNPKILELKKLCDGLTAKKPFNYTEIREKVLRPLSEILNAEDDKELRADIKNAIKKLDCIEQENKHKAEELKSDITRINKAMEELSNVKLGILSTLGL